jgi:hypothetical protein
MREKQSRKADDSVLNWESEKEDRGRYSSHCTRLTARSDIQPLISDDPWEMQA